MKKKRLSKTALEFRKELKKSFATALTSAIGILLALTWKDVLTAYFDSLSQVTPFRGQLITAILITIISTIIILFISRYVSKENSN